MAEASPVREALRPFTDHAASFSSGLAWAANSSWKGRREKFRADHQQEIDLYYTSQRILKEKHGVKKIDIPAWKKEQAELRKKEEERATRYKFLREKLQLSYNQLNFLSKITSINFLIRLSNIWNVL